MPLIRPLVRHFPRPSTSSSTSTTTTIPSAYLLSFSAQSAPSATLSRQPNTHLLQVKGFSTSQPSQSSHGGPHLEPPGGWLFNVPPGEKYQNEGWEHFFVWGIWGTLAVTAVAYAFKPDTSIQTWALEEARRRLEAEGILPDPDAGGADAKAN